MEPNKIPDNLKEIHLSIDTLLNSKTDLKSKRKNTYSYRKDLFIQSIEQIQASVNRNIDLNSQIGIDLSSYDDIFHSTIENFIQLAFGKEGLDLVLFYLYGRFNSNGTINILVDSSGTEVKLENAEHLWEILINISSQIKK